MMVRYNKEILGFRMNVSKIEAAFKLSQNRSHEDQNEIVEDLKKCSIHDNLIDAMRIENS